MRLRRYKPTKVHYAWGYLYSCILVYAHSPLLNYGEYKDSSTIVLPENINPYLCLLGLSDVIGIAVSVWMLKAIKERQGETVSFHKDSVGKWVVGIVSIVPLLASLMGLLYVKIQDACYCDEVLGVWKNSTGQEYVFLTNNAWLDSDFWLAKRISDRKLQILNSEGYYEGCGKIRFVQPEGRDITGLFSVDGVLLGVEGGEAAITYDLRPENAKREEVEFSPFMFVGPKDRPSEFGFQNIMNPDPHTWGRPSSLAVKRDLHNPNPRVREMAAAFLARFPIATQSDAAGKPPDG